MSTATSAGPVGHEGVRVEIAERHAFAVSGWLGVLAVAACILVTNYALRHGPAWAWVPIVVGLVIVVSLVVVAPGQTLGRAVLRPIPAASATRVLVDEAVHASGAVSVRVRNFKSDRLKVNDADGNPVEIAAIVVWQVVETAKATFDVDDYASFVDIQAESAIRHLASATPTTPATARSAARLDRPGGRPSWPRRSPPASRSPGSRSSRCGSPTWPTPRRSPRRCCGGSRRTPSSRPAARIVEGAVGMVEMALDRLSEHGVVELDEERKASMVSNLLVVLCGDQPASPVVNAGSLYYVTARKEFLLRLDPAVHDALMRWADDELRSVTRRSSCCSGAP